MPLKPFLYIIMKLVHFWAGLQQFFITQHEQGWGVGGTGGFSSCRKLLNSQISISTDELLYIV